MTFTLQRAHRNSRQFVQCPIADINPRFVSTRFSPRTSWLHHNCAAGGRHVYDATKFSAEVMMGMMRTHPLVIVDSEARPNPFYVPPEELLKELRAYKPARLNTI
jgi:hypothetical protein